MIDRKVLHIGSAEKFMPQFIELIKENFDVSCHEFWLSKGMAENDIIQDDKTHVLPNHTKTSRLKHYTQVLIKMHQADKIILHSLSDITIVKILFFSPWLLKKCYWVIWGNDLYTYKFGKRNRRWRIREIYRRLVIKNMGYLVTYMQGDINLAREWYGAKGEYKECLMYVSNTYKEVKFEEKLGNQINIQLGNSANSTNNHIEILTKLVPFKDENIRVYTPLSYSDKKHAKKVIKTGNELLGNKFYPMTDFMPFDEYLRFQGSIDIGIFNNSRQQALGNIITLLGLGKTVYMRNNTSQWKLFKDKGLSIYNVKNFDSLEYRYHENNVTLVKEYFSKQNLIRQLSGLF